MSKQQTCKTCRFFIDMYAISFSSRAVINKRVSDPLKDGSKLCGLCVIDGRWGELEARSDVDVSAGCACWEDRRRTA